MSAGGNPSENPLSMQKPVRVRISQGQWLFCGIVLLALCGMLVGCDASKRRAERYYQAGVEYKEQNAVSRAGEQFRLALAQDITFADAHVELGALLCRSQEYQLTIKQCLQALQYGSLSYKPHALMGYAFERLGHTTHAVLAYTRALQRAPQLIDIRLRLADLFEAEGKREDAADLLQEVLTLKPETDQAEFLRSRLSLLRQPDTPTLHYDFADLYVRQGKIARGLEAYRTVEAFTPDMPETIVEFGLFCLERDQFAAAVGYLEQAKTLGQTDQLEVWAGLGIAHEALGQFGEAVQEYQRVLEIQPDWHEVRLKLAELFEALERPAEAADQLEAFFHASKHPHFTGTLPDINQLWKEILRLRGQSATKAVVQVSRLHQYPLVEGILNHQAPATLIVEERAQYTILSEDLARTLGFQITPHTSEVHFEIAGHHYTAPLVNLSSLQIGELEVRNIPTLIWNLNEYPGVDGFLGKSFLKHFQVETNYQKNLLILTR